MQEVAVITGASRGIGRACAIELAKKNVKVIANYNKSKEKAEELKRELAEQGIEIDIFKCDVSKREEVKEMINFVLNKYGKIDILINNAGIAQEKLFTDLTDEDIDKMIDVNLKSVFYVTQETIKDMIHRQEGCIINISSVWGITGGSCEVHYSATKAGIIGMTKALAKEVGLSNIRVNAIAPGAIDTDMNKNLNQLEIEDLEKEIPLKRMGTPKDIANAVYMLIRNPYITGQVIKVDGGWID
ncbi:MAG: 3-oxoacyl-ACP reductase FabG [Clostridia bacterium]|nr:3-oxoacyl-ACP reductase FabG [Clostridia bacterium]